MTHKKENYSHYLPLQTCGKARAIINRNNSPFMWAILYEGSFCTLQNNNNEVSNIYYTELKEY